MAIPEAIKDAAWYWERELTSFWNGSQPNHLGLEGLRRLRDEFGGVFPIRQGDGRPKSRFPFRDDSLDYEVGKTLAILVGAARREYQDLLAVALVIYPCDIDQYEPHGQRGRTMIPFQLAFLEAGVELVKQGEVYLPRGMTPSMIPRTLRSPDPQGVLF